MRDDAASTQVLEAVMVGILVVTSIAFVVTFKVPTTTFEEERTEIQTLLTDAVAALAARESEDEPDVYGSQLEQYVMEALSGDNSGIVSYLDALLPRGAKYNVYLHNGYEPRVLISKGSPPEESVASTLLFAPHLSYSFVEPQVKYNHGDFPMTIYEVPVKNSILVKDEGFPMRVTAMFTEEAPGAPGVYEDYQVVSYTTSALVDNSDEKYAQVSMYLEDTDGSPTLYVPLSLLDQVQEGEKIRFDTTFNLVLAEDANVPVPKNTLLTVKLPRGWLITEEQQDDIESDPILGNAVNWRSIRFSGDIGVGYTIQAELVQNFQDEAITFRFPASYEMIVDTAHNFFTEFDAWLDNGAHGRAEWFVSEPNANVVGAFLRTGVVTTPKPFVAGQDSTMGFVFVNAGQKVTLKQLDIEAEWDSPVFKDVDLLDGGGAWTVVDDGAVDLNRTLRWTGVQDILTGEHYESFARVLAWATGPAEYRNANYVRTHTTFEPTFLLEGTNTLPLYSHQKDLYRQGGPYLFRDKIDPDDDFPGDPPLFTGWPDESGNSYYFFHDGFVDYARMKGNGSFSVLPAGSSSQLFGSYSGPVQSAAVTLYENGAPTRDLELGDSLTIRNDFSALFQMLTDLADDDPPDRIDNDVVLVSTVYGPEGAYAHRAKQEFREFAGDLSTVASSLGQVLAVELDGDGKMDAIAAGGLKGVYAVNGLDGTKYWSYLPDGRVTAMGLGDFDRDGKDELAVGDDLGKLYVLEISPSLSSSSRLLWSADVNETAPEAVRDIATGFDLTGNKADDIVVATGNDLRGGVYVFDHFRSGYRAWEQAMNAADGKPNVNAVEIVTEELADGREFHHVVSGDSSFYVRSFNGTTGAEEWYIKYNDEVVAMTKTQLNGDGWDDLVVATKDGWIMALNGRKGTDDYDTLLGPATANWVDILTLDEGTVYAAPNWTQGMMVSQKNLYDITFIKPVGTGPIYTSMDFLSRDYGWIVDTDGHVWHTETDAKNVSTYQNVGDLKSAEPTIGVDNPPVRVRFADEDFGVVVTAKGQVLKTTDGGTTWTKLRSLCHDDAESCSLKVTVRDLDKTPDGSGTAFYAVGNVSTGGLFPAARGGALWKMGATDAEFSVVLYDAATRMNGVDFVSPSTGFIVGDGGFFKKTTNGGSSWTTQALPGGETPRLWGVSMTDASNGYAVGVGAAMYHLVDGGDAWSAARPEIPEGQAVYDFYSVSTSALGRAWAGAKSGIMVSTLSYDWEDLLYTDTLGAGLATPTGVKDLQWVTRERHFNTLPGALANTDLDWYYSLGSTGTWTLLPKDEWLDGDASGVRYYHNATIDCSAASCAKVRLKGVFQTFADPSGNENDMLPAELVELVSMQWVDAGVPGDTVSWYGAADATHALWDPASSSTRMSWADTWTMSLVEKFWSYRVGTSIGGIPMDGQMDFTGDGVPEPVVALTFADEVFVLDGLRGIKLKQWDTDEGRGFREVITGDFNGEPGTAQIVFVYSDTAVASPFPVGRVIDYASGTAIQIETDGQEGSIGGGLARGGDLNLDGRPEFFLSRADGDLELLEADAPNVPLWTGEPSASQGKADFLYVVPRSSLYGTHFVVSELRFEIDEGGVPVTQVARIMDWFNVRPPGGVLPEPPFYDLEVVVWFDEQ